MNKYLKVQPIHVTKNVSISQIANLTIFSSLHQCHSFRIFCRPDNDWWLSLEKILSQSGEPVFYRSEKNKNKKSVRHRENNQEIIIYLKKEKKKMLAQVQEIWINHVTKSQSPQEMVQKKNLKFYWDCQNMWQEEKKLSKLSNIWIKYFIKYLSLIKQFT